MTSANILPLNQSDEHIVRSLVHDLDTGFVQLFEKYRRIVFSTALRIRGGWADAEDLTAEAFLRAYRALCGYRPGQIMALKLRTWLLTITLNVCRNHQRDAGRQPACTPWDEVDEPVDRPDERVDVEQAITDRETGRELAGLLAALPERQRVAVVLRHVVDLPIAEIAEILGRSPRHGQIRHLPRPGPLAPPVPARPDHSGQTRPGNPTSPRGAAAMTPDQPPVTPVPDDALTEGLAALTANGPPGLLERIAARWARVPGPSYDLYVASTHRGVVYVRTSDAVHDDAAEFATQFHRRFAQPLLAGGQPPPSNRDRFDLSRLGAFERAVLLAVLTIPRGQVRPYDWLAGRVGPQATAHRVDVVLRDNPIPVLIPCHRVINADGTLGEHVLGQDVKRGLLAEEGTNVGEVYTLASLDIRFVASDATGTVCCPTCPHARTTNRTGYSTMTQARAAGYRPCPHCHPAADGAD